MLVCILDYLDNKFSLDGQDRSESLKDNLNLLKNGTNLFKVRDKGMRGLQMYKRKFWLDMENLLIHFSPHKDPTTKLGCLANGENYFVYHDAQ